MAVDANVLIFERIREELRLGRSPISAVDAGYRRALTTIIDANLTTLIAAVLLYIFGSGPVRGLAVTLGIGLITSMFTARSEEHTSELPSLMRNSSAVFCLKKQNARTEPFHIVLLVACHPAIRHPVTL